jgi:Concanavalin A-like lectin/glucanases superfamily
VGVRKGLLLLVAVQAALAGTASAEPVGRWALDEGAGQIAADSSGRGHDGRLGDSSKVDAHDPSWVPGRFGSGLRFDANRNLFVSIGNSLGLQLERVTVEAWVRRLGTPGQWRYVFSAGANECVAAPYGLYSGFDGGLAFYVSHGGGYAVSPDAVPSRVWDGGWHYAVGTYDGASVRLYLDGVEVGSGTPASHNIGYGSTPAGIFIGTYSGSCSLPFTGDIDEVLIHDAALTAPQVSARARAAAGMPTPPQIGPVKGAPVTGTVAPGCLSVTVNPRRIVVKRRTKVLVSVRRGKAPAGRRRVAVQGAGLNRVVRTGRKGRARLVVRASRHGRLRFKLIGHPKRCPAKFVPVTRST